MNASSQGNIFKLKPYEGKINAMYSTVSGALGGEANIFGIKIKCKAKGYIGAVGAKAQVQIGGHPKFKIGADAALGIGGGGTCGIDW